MKVSVLQDDNFFYHDIELSAHDIRNIYFGHGIDQNFQYDIIGKKDLVICITREIKEQEDTSWKII